MLQPAKLILFLMAVSPVVLAQQSNQPLIQPDGGWRVLILLVGAIIGAIAAFIGVAINRSTSQKQAAIDILLKLRTDRDFLEAQDKFREAVKEGKLDAILSAPSNPKDYEVWLKTKLIIQNFLNIHELICVAIKQHVVDEITCKTLVGDALVKRWKDDDLQGAAAVGTLLEVDIEHPFEQAGPAQAGRRRGRRRVTVIR